MFHKITPLSKEEAERLIERIKPFLETVDDKNLCILYHGKKGNFRLQVYINESGRCRLVANDKHTLDKILEGKGFLKSNKSIVWIDDAGCGCPLGGVLMGVYDEETKTFAWGEVEPKYFQGTMNEKKAYLERVADIVEYLLMQLGITEEKHRIQICSGHVNTEAKNRLRKKGFEVDMECKIKDPLQTLLENQHSKYLYENYGFETESYDYRDINLAARKLLRKKKELRKHAKEHAI